MTQLKGLTSMMELVSGNGFAREGYPVRGLFSIPFAGLDADGIPQYLIDGKLTTTGVNFQEREKLDYLKYEGPTDPTVTGSFGNVFTYKGFKLNVFMTYSFGNVVRLDLCSTINTPTSPPCRVSLRIVGRSPAMRRKPIYQ